MRIVTWNIVSYNSIVSNIADKYVNFGDMLTQWGVDIFCIQETKMSSDKLTPKLLDIKGYESFWSVCTKKKGYSGVATFVKEGPYSPMHSSSKPFNNPEFDDEGRVMITDHGAFIVVNIYAPNAGDHNQGRPRLDYKVRFYRALIEILQSYKAQGKEIILVGDFNIAHNGKAGDVYWKMLDLPFHGYSEEELEILDNLITSYEPGPIVEEKTLSATFSSLPESVQNIQRVDLVDVWRHVHPTEKNRFTVWDWSTRARSRNEGVRIDYVLVGSKLFAKYGLRSELMECPPIVEMQDVQKHNIPGSSAIINTPTLWSDHVPVLVVLSPLPGLPPHSPCLGSSKRIISSRGLMGFFKKPASTSKEASPVEKAKSTSPSPREELPIQEPSAQKRTLEDPEFSQQKKARTLQVFPSTNESSVHKKGTLQSFFGKTKASEAESSVEVVVIEENNKLEQKSIEPTKKIRSHVFG